MKYIHKRDHYSVIKGHMLLTEATIQKNFEKFTLSESQKQKAPHDDSIHMECPNSKLQGQKADQSGLRGGGGGVEWEGLLSRSCASLEGDRNSPKLKTDHRTTV